VAKGAKNLGGMLSKNPWSRLAVVNELIKKNGEDKQAILDLTKSLGDDVRTVSIISSQDFWSQLERIKHFPHPIFSQEILTRAIRKAVRKPLGNSVR
jgi:hypothetical protein